VLDFLKSLFKPQGSGATAKERLRLVLLSDHLSLAPDMIDALKADLLEVFSRYFEYDAKQAEVSFDHREREVAMLASVPIQRVRERSAAPRLLHVVPDPEPANAASAIAPIAEAAAEPAPAVVEAEAPVAEAPASETPLAEAPASQAPESTDAQDAESVAVAPVAKPVAPQAPGSRSRKRRRKRSGGANGVSMNGAAMSGQHANASLLSAGQ
jgi:cell division topological specificity factor